jgi:hypothetical protein
MLYICERVLTIYMRVWNSHFDYVLDGVCHDEDTLTSLRLRYGYLCKGWDEVGSLFCCLSPIWDLCYLRVSSFCRRKGPNPACCIGLEISTFSIIHIHGFDNPVKWVDHVDCAYQQSQVNGKNVCHIFLDSVVLLFCCWFRICQFDKKLYILCHAWCVHLSLDAFCCVCLFMFKVCSYPCNLCSCVWS